MRVLVSCGAREEVKGLVTSSVNVLTRTVANFFGTTKGKKNGPLGSYKEATMRRRTSRMFAEFLQKAPPKAKPEVV